MKVLFAIGNDQKTKNIADRYYEKFGEVLEYKNIFYFKALIEEVKHNKTYDRIIIDEELEQYRTRDIEQLDRLLYNHIDLITDEIEDADIILICADRRSKGDNFVNTLFARGIYNLLIGDDRNINPLCDMIKKPKTKKEAKQYLRIDTSLIGDTRIAIDEEINEQQMISILNFYEGIRNQPEKYLETFDRIAEQYSRTQLKIILNYLPKEVREVVIKADRYKYLAIQEQTTTKPPVVNNVSTTNKAKKQSGGLFSAFKKNKEDNSKNIGTVQITNLSKPNGTISLNNSTDERKQRELATKAKAEAMAREQAELEAKAKQLEKEQERLKERAKAEAEARRQAELVARARKEAEEREQAELAARAKAEAEARNQAELAAKAKAENEARKQAELEAKAKAEVEARKQAEFAAKAKAEAEVEARKQAELAARAKAEAEARNQAELMARAKAEAKAREQAELTAKNKTENIKNSAGINVPTDSGFIVEIKPNPNAPVRNVTQTVEKKSTLPAVEIEIETKPIEKEKIANIPQSQIKVETLQASKQNVISEQEKKMREEQERLLQEQKRIKEAKEKLEEERRKLKEEQERLANEQNKIVTPPQNNYSQNTVYSSNTTNRTNTQVVPVGTPRMVVFVGANKAGTTFVTNAVAHFIASTKVRTSILDMTRDKSMYYLYNQNDKTLRKRATECMQRVSDGEDSFLDTNNSYLKVYTALPGMASDVRRSYKHKTVINTVKNNCNVAIVDADFTTPIDYFDQADEIYIVQDLDLLKMPDTTLFLRELKNRGISMKKIKIIVNKYVKTSLSPKQVVQALSYYNDPSMSFVDEVLPSRVDSYVIPYNLNNYAKYIDSVCHGIINYKGYSADFMQAIEEIASRVCPKGSTPKSSRKLFG